ncbi:MAG TPA: hypothetical protein VKX46_05055 [Ktedonobacteraceae bacterium]|nr:hypothetical protein [Ktedonobacteraceae bacterium]
MAKYHTHITGRVGKIIRGDNQTILIQGDDMTVNGQAAEEVEEWEDWEDDDEEQDQAQGQSIFINGRRVQ